MGEAKPSIHYMIIHLLRKYRNTAGAWQAALFFSMFAATFALLNVPTAFAQENAKPAVDGYKDTPMLPGNRWHVHDPDRPQPAVVTPGTPPLNRSPRNRRRTPLCFSMVKTCRNGAPEMATRLNGKSRMV